MRNRTLSRGASAAAFLLAVLLFTSCAQQKPLTQGRAKPAKSSCNCGKR